MLNFVVVPFVINENADLLISGLTIHVLVRQVAFLVPDHRYLLALIY